MVVIKRILKAITAGSIVISPAHGLSTKEVPTGGTTKPTLLTYDVSVACAAKLWAGIDGVTFKTSLYSKRMTEHARLTLH